MESHSQDTVKKTKILATIGPASNHKKTLMSMMRAGVDLIRINASHNSKPDYVNQTVSRVAKAAKDVDKPVGVLLDLQGPKIRVGKFSRSKIEIKTGRKFTLTTKNTTGSSQIASVSYKGLVDDVSVGDPIYINDGSIRLQVISKGEDEVVCKILQGGVLSNYKGVNVPRTTTNMSAITTKDRQDIKLAIQNRIDYIALSFVENAQDVHELRQLLVAQDTPDIKIIAKIERQKALDDIVDIIEAADGVMVARGDLGVEIGVEHVPEAQKRIIYEANRRIKPVIVATQMLETMIYKPDPTRAEVSDVANAIYDRCDTVMLSGETAVGVDPVQAVSTMGAICWATDQHMMKLKAAERLMDKYQFAPQQHSITATFAKAANQIAEENRAAALIVFTNSGTTSLISSKLNPAIPIIAVTEQVKSCNRMTMYRGVTPLHMPELFGKLHRWRDMIAAVLKLAKQHGLVKKGDTVVVTAGIPINRSGGTNSIRLLTVG